MKFLRTSVSVLTGALLVAVLMLAGAVFLVPRVMGGSAMTVLTGSMEPTIQPGDVIAVRKADPTRLAVGDVVTFQPVSGESTLITHRIVGMGASGNKTSFTTQGDNNSAADEPITVEQIKGVYMYRIPMVGHVLNFGGGLSNPWIKFGALGLLLFAAVSFVWPGRDSEKVAPMAPEGEEISV